MGRKADIGAVTRPGCGLHGVMADAKNKEEGRGHYRDLKRALIITPLPPSTARLSVLRRCPASFRGAAFPGCTQGGCLAHIY